MDLGFLARVQSEIEDFFLVFDRQQFFDYIPEGMGITFFERIGLYPSQVVAIWDSRLKYTDPSGYYPEEYMFIVPHYLRGYQIDPLSKFFEAFLVSEYEEACTNYFSCLDDNYWNIQILVRAVDERHSRR